MLMAIARHANEFFIYHPLLFFRLTLARFERQATDEGENCDYTRNNNAGEYRRCYQMTGLLFRIFTRQQLVQLVAAHVTEVLTLYEVENVFANVLAAVTDTLDGARAEQGRQHARDRAGIFHHVGHQLAHDASILLIDLLVFTVDTHRFVQIHPRKGIQHVVQHLHGVAASDSRLTSSG